MATFKPLFASQSADISNSQLNSLANGSVATSSAVDNSSNLYQDFLIEVYIDGTAAANAYLEVRLAIASDGGTNYGTWESAIPLGIIDLSVDLQRAFFSLVGHGGLFQAPQYFKIMVKNGTGAALAASGSTIKHQGIQIQSV